MRILPRRNRWPSGLKRGKRRLRLAARKAGKWLLKELDDLNSLKRGVYVRRDITAGTPITRADVFSPCLFWLVNSNPDVFVTGLSPIRIIRLMRCYRRRCVQTRCPKEIIYHTIHAVKGMLNQARIPIGHDFAVELSHH